MSENPKFEDNGSTVLEHVKADSVTSELTNGGSQSTANESKYPKSSTQENSDSVLFVGGLSEQTKKEALKAYFEQFGGVEDVQIIVDYVTGKSKRCALIFCASKEIANLALVKKKHMLERRKMRVSKADLSKRGTKVIKAKQLHLTQIHPSITNEDLEAYLKTFGPIKKLRLTPAQDPSQDPISSFTRSGYLELHHEEDCLRILEQRRSLEIYNKRFSCMPFRIRNQQEAHLVDMIRKAPENQLIKYF